MVDSRRGKLFVLWVLSACLFASQQAFSAGRTTPVEVMNTPLVGIDSKQNEVSISQVDPWLVEVIGTPGFIIANVPTVKIDGSTNTVKAAQSGTWTVGVSSMPTVNVNTHAVTQSGTWNVGITGTPSVSIANIPNVNISNTPNVSVSNSPTVKIDSSANVVDTPTRGAAHLLFATDQVIPNGGQVISDPFDCLGYKEVRFVISNNFAGDNLWADAEFQSPLGSAYWLTAHKEHLNLNEKAFCVPVYNRYCRIRIMNFIGSTVTIYRDSWVYKVN